ncbi:MAG: FixH family protein [Polyangiaceae bacterium]|nr:FixH family protein [Polyangiaceae bacterium]
MRVWLLAAALLALGSGCSSSDDPQGSGGTGGAGTPCGGRGETFSAGMTHPGDDGALTFTLVSATPAPPQLFDNSWLLELSAAGAALDGATLTVSTWMPDHEHGSPKQTQVSPQGDGRYQLSPVNLFMPGLWEVRVEAQSGSTSDGTTFTFCVG